MNIRRFVAADMRTALQMVRDAHGPDAVILSNRRTDEGVEIVAASNYDEACLQRALDAQPRPPVPPAAPAAAAAEAPLAPAERWLRELATPAAATPHADATPGVPAPAPRPRAVAPTTPLAAPAVDAPRAAPASLPGHATASESSRIPATPPAGLASGDVAGFDEDFDGPAFADLLARTRRPVAPVVEPPAPLPMPAAPALAAVPTPPAPASDGELARMRDELAQMRTMIEREMARLTDERLRGSPVRAQAMELLEDYGFDAGITRDVVLQIPADTPAHRARGLMLGLVSRKLPICPVDPLHEAGVIALVGPTGAGKTTTIAKLAALYAAQHQPRDVALVTTDTARIGGREQLHSYGRQLGIAVHEADTEAGLLQLLQKLQDYRLVLVDTAGLSQRDRALAGQLNWLRAARQVRTLLVLPANTHFADLDEVVRRFEHARPQGVVLTKLDETSRLGSALSVVVDHQLPLTWTTDGQRIPEDLHRANAAHLVLRLEDLRRDADKPLASEHSAPEHDHAVA